MPFQVARRVASFGTTIFSEMSRLSLEHGAINLSQGFPDFDGPMEAKQAAIDAILAGDNQYAITFGQPALRRAVAEHARRFYGQVCDPDAEITVLTGATEALFCAVLGLVDPGDEVIVFEPYYDSYVASVVMAGAVPRCVPLRPPDWTFDPAELAAAFNERTRLVIVNTPHNPTGKMFSLAELEQVADLARRWDVAVMADEAYEHLIYDGARHHRLAMLPGMAERTITVSSQAKTFGFTGWKIGWAIAPPALTAGIRRAHQFVTFASGTPFQAAAAVALGLDDEYFAALAADYQSKRDFLAGALENAGFKISRPQGTYFIMADFSGLARQFEDDAAFCRWLITEIGIAAVPPSAFCRDENKAMLRTWARFAFCKKQETLERAAERLARIPAAL